MRIRITKGERDDRVEAIRADGTTAFTTVPHKGPLPHDLVHFAVEQELGFDRGFWGMVASGSRFEEVAELAKIGGHASAKRAFVPDASIVPMLQAERMVECFEADLWGGSQGHPGTLREMIAAGCEQSLVPPIEASDSAIDRIRSTLAELQGQWSSVAEGCCITLEWPGSRS